MPFALFRQIGQALKSLNPDEVRKAAERPVRLGLVAASHEDLLRMESYFCPPHLSPERRAEVSRLLVHGPGPCDIQIYDAGLLVPGGAFAFDPGEPEPTVRAIMERHPDLWLPLARHFHPFHKPVAQRLIHRISRENALFCLASALPDIVPSFISLPWAVTEFASDTAFLTVNQVRLAFLLAAASDREVGFREQRGAIASLFTGAFGWRALARELVGKIPFGGGLIPKAAVGWAGTFVTGLSLEQFYRVGYGFSRAERRGALEEAYKHGKEVARLLLDGLHRPA